MRDVNYINFDGTSRAHCLATPLADCCPLLCHFWIHRKRLPVVRIAESTPRWLGSIRHRLCFPRHHAELELWTPEETPLRDEQQSDSGERRRLVIKLGNTARPRSVLLLQRPCTRCIAHRSALCQKCANIAPDIGLYDHSVFASENRVTGRANAGRAAGLQRRLQVHCAVRVHGRHRLARKRIYGPSYREPAEVSPIRRHIQRHVGQPDLPTVD